MNLELKTTAFYQVGGSLDFNHPTYINRQADHDIYNLLKSGEYCYVFNSRQMGKSSLRVQTKHKLQALGFACAEIDFTGIIGSQTTPEQVYAGIIQTLVNSFQLQFNWIQWWREQTELSPGQKLNEFIEKHLFPEIQENIVIFLDEIDSCFEIKSSLNFSLNLLMDDILAWIRYCYDRRADHPEYKRLTFALFGVNSPSDLIRGNHKTVINIGHAIELTGFQTHEVLPLANGLLTKTHQPQTLLQAILDWTGGQPFLTQKLCQFVVNSPEPIFEGREKQYIKKMVESQVIENWEYNDNPEHLRTIRDRLLISHKSTKKLLNKILKFKQVTADDSLEQIELQLSGLVVKTQGKLKLYNRLYQAVFTPAWFQQVLADQHPLNLKENLRLVLLFFLSLLGFRSRFPKLHVQLNDQGCEQAIAHRLKLAKFCLKAAIILKPDYNTAHYNLGSVYEKNHEFDQAKVEYLTAISGGVLEAYNNLAKICIFEKQYQDADLLLKTALEKPEIEHEPLVQYALLKNYGWLCLKTSRYREAEGYLRQAIDVMNTRSVAYGLLAQVLEAQGKREKAKQVWQEFRQKSALDQDLSPEVEALKIIAP